MRVLVTGGAGFIGSSVGVALATAIGVLGASHERKTALQRAFEARGRRLVEQRLRLGSEIENLERELASSEDRLAEQRHQIEALELKIRAGGSRIAELESVLHSLLTSRSIRYTAPLRTFFGLIRRRVT